MELGVFIAGLAIFCLFKILQPWVVLKDYERVALPYIAKYSSPAEAGELKERINSSEFLFQWKRQLKCLRNYAFMAAQEKFVKEHAKVLIRKRASSLYVDDYGQKKRNKWNKEVKYFVENILIPSLRQESIREPDVQIGDSVMYKAYVDLYDMEAIDYYIKAIDVVLDVEELDIDECPSMLPESGHDYERYVAAIFESYGYSARVTKGSGDHGADIVVHWGGGEIVVQCKHYSSPVGNKAVQEAYSAKGFYDADQAWVVASSSFTPAAKIAAERLGVLLLHHEDLPEMLEAIDSGSV